MSQTTAVNTNTNTIFDQFESQFNGIFDDTALSLADAFTAPKLDKKAASDNSALHKAHAATISASNAHRIMGNLDQAALPEAARAYIERMVAGGVGTGAVVTESMQWGIATESLAIEALKEQYNSNIVCTGDDQERFYQGDFISALPDGVIYDEEGLLKETIEVKCLDTGNHEKTFTILTASELKMLEWEKYCQVQTQLLCTGAKSGVIAFYDPRHIENPLHLITVLPDQEWVKTFLARVDQAKAYYLAILQEDQSNPAFTASDQPAPEVSMLPRVQIDIKEVATYHHEPEKLVEKIRQQAGSFVFDMCTAKGRDACRSHAANIIKCISPMLSASKNIAAEAKKTLEADLYFRKIAEKGVREIAENARRPLTEWEAEQERIEAEQARIEAEAAEQQRLEQKFLADWDAGLVENELFDFRKEKAGREARELAERQAKEREDYERKLQEQAVERERERIAEAHRIAEANRQREAEQKEHQRLAAIARAERAEAENIEALARAEREKQLAEEREERAKRAAEQAAIAREQAAIEQERRRQEAQRQQEEQERERIQAAEAKQAANRAHRARVNNQIAIRLADIGVDETLAKTIIQAAAKRELGALVIHY